MNSHSGSFREIVQLLLICPITKLRLVDPHVIRIDGKKNITVSGSELRVLPNAFQANKPHFRLVTCNEVVYEVEVCFDRVIYDLLAQLDSDDSDERFKEKVEQALTCPITNELFDRPVITSTGYTYSRMSWEGWKARPNARNRDMNGATVTFVDSHGLVEALVAVYLQHYPQQHPQQQPAAEGGLFQRWHIDWSSPRVLSVEECATIAIPLFGTAGLILIAMNVSDGRKQAMVAGFAALFACFSILMMARYYYFNRGFIAEYSATLSECPAALWRYCCPDNSLNEMRGPLFLPTNEP